MDPRSIKPPVEALSEFNGMLKDKAHITDWHHKWTPWLTAESINTLLETYYKPYMAKDAMSEETPKPC